MRKIQNSRPVNKKSNIKQIVLPVNKQLMNLRTMNTKKKYTVETNKQGPIKKFNKQKFLEQQLMQSQNINNSSTCWQVFVITIYFLSIYMTWVLDKYLIQIQYQKKESIDYDRFRKFQIYFLYTELTILVLFIYEIIQRFKNSLMKTSEKNDLRLQSFLLLTYLVIVIIETLNPMAKTLEYKAFKLALVILRIIFFLRKLSIVFKFNTETKNQKFKFNIDKVLFIQKQILNILKDKKIKLQLDTNIKMIKHNKLLNIFDKKSIPSSPKNQNKKGITSSSNPKENMTVSQFSRLNKGSRQQQTNYEIDIGDATIEEQPNKWRGNNTAHPVASSLIIEIPSKVLVYIDVNWDRITFSPFMLEEISDQQGLYYYMLYQLQRRSYFRSLRLEEEKCEALSQTICQNYFSSNPYHNATHALDVLQTSLSFVYGCQYLQVARLNSLDQLALLLSTAAHDLGHPAVNSLFLSNALHPLAMHYSNKAVLENYHCAHFFSFYYRSEFNITSHLSATDQLYFRSVFIQLVLSTDMSRHFSDLALLQTALDSPQLDLSGAHKQLTLNAIVHAADISNPIKNGQLYTKWVDLIMEEFFCQGDKEKEIGLPVSPQCDRSSVNIAKSQESFISIMIVPLFGQLVRFLPLLEPHLSQIKYNQQYYQFRVTHYDQLLMDMKHNDDKQSGLDSKDNNDETDNLIHIQDNLS